MGQDDRQVIANEFLALRGRFERAAAISDDGGRDLHAAEVAAGKLLARFCRMVKVGLVLPDIQPTKPNSDDESAQWAIAWKQGVYQLSFIYSDSPIVNPLSVRWEYRGGPEQVTVGRTDPDDWRIRAENYAAMCGALANVVADMAATNRDSDVGTSIDDNVGYDALAAATLVAHPEWRDIQIAASIGCNPKTLYKPYMKKFKAAKGALKSGREEYRDDSLRESRNVHGPDKRRRQSNINRYDRDD